MSRRSRRSFRTGEGFFTSNDQASLPRPIRFSDYFPVTGRAMPALFQAFDSEPVFRPSRRAYVVDVPSYGPKRVFRSRSPQAWLKALQVRVPRKVKLCFQRTKRREVLFALRKAGFSGSARKRHYLRTQNSQWSC